MTARPLLVVEDDPVLHLVPVILSADAAPARVAAYQDFFAHDLPDFEAWRSHLRERLPLYPASIQMVASKQDMAEALPEADGLIVEGLTVGAAEIAAAPALKVVQKFGTVTTNIDMQACAACGIRTLTLRRRANVSCAEHTLGMMLALAHKIRETDGVISLERLRAAGYAPKLFDRAHTANSNWARIPGIRTVFGAQLGIVGLGEIGRELAVRASACGMKVVYTQRNKLAPEEEACHQARFVTLDNLLTESDYISLHLPGGPATRGILGRRELGLLKPGAMLINNSRAELVDRAALLETLFSGHLGGFATDLPYDEPGLDDDPLLRFRNVIVTPHIAAQPRFNALSDFEEMLINIAQVLQRPARSPVY